MNKMKRQISSCGLIMSNRIRGSNFIQTVETDQCTGFNFARVEGGSSLIKNSLNNFSLLWLLDLNWCNWLTKYTSSLLI